MKRREFLTGVLAFAHSYASFAQESGKTYRIGSLHSAPLGAPHHVAFFEELQRAGFVVGKNLVVDRQGYGLRQDQFAVHAEQLVSERVDAILCAGDLAIGLAKRLTSIIPVLGVTEDMVTSGLVQSLSRPDQNITGVSILAADLDGKRQEILFEILPTLRHIALLADTNTMTASHLSKLEEAAKAKGVQLSTLKVKRAEEIGPAIDALTVGAGDTALNVLATPLFFNNRQTIFDRVASRRLPAIYEWPEMATDGGLVSQPDQSANDQAIAWHQAVRDSN